MNQTNAQLLNELHKRLKTCTRCSELVDNRTQVVPGAGNANADIMFVGEAPGRDEDVQGIPFVGQAGKILNDLLNETGIPREAVFIGNVLKCRPPDNRDPLDYEIANCREYLHAQIALIRPKLICTLGNPSLKTLINKSMTIGKVHGKVITLKGIKFFPIYHPAAALHNRANMKPLKEDFEKLKKLLQKM
ncbi:uracil-DNA glycosylase [bacterium]|nr:uracil-DNA glycosylase [bacterium]